MVEADLLKPPSEAARDKNAPSLGFGAMRLPQGGQTVRQMIYLYMDAGFNVFDTAYVYNKSEDTLKKELVSRHPRTSFLLADKLPPWLTKNREQSDKLLRESLWRCGVDYFDFYLIHSIDDNGVKNAEAADVFDWAAEQKDKGYCRHVGFSFHGGAELLDRLFSSYLRMEFVMLQLNYMDVLRGNAGRLYQTALKHDKPIFVMEPVKGGSLASLPEEAENILKSFAPERSVASWALRFSGSLAGVSCVFSGMSSLAQVQDNIKTFKNFAPLSKEESDALNRAIEEMSKISAIPCTSCNYCLESCPEKIEIPVCFALYNESKRGGAHWNRQTMYDSIPKGRRAVNCNSCGACVLRCPQHIEIPLALKEVAGAFK